MVPNDNDITSTPKWTIPCIDIKVHYNNTVLTLTNKPIPRYNLTELENEIRSSDVFQNILFPDQDIRMQYDNCQLVGKGVTRVEIKTDGQLQHAMKTCPGLTLEIYLTAFFSPTALTTRIIEMDAKLSTAQKKLEDVNAWIQRFVGQQENIVHLMKKLQERMSELESEKGNTGN